MAAKCKKCNRVGERNCNLKFCPNRTPMQNPYKILATMRQSGYMRDRRERRPDDQKNKNWLEDA